jgi:hypothetical protein
VATEAVEEWNVGSDSNRILTPELGEVRIAFTARDVGKGIALIHPQLS